LFEDCLDLCHDLIVPKAQYPVTPALQESRPSLICFSLRGMLTAIKLYHQSAFQAAKVSDEGTDEMLAAELSLTELPRA
jgi:hypothetical protein